MPWYFPWSDGLKKRSCRYLLQRYLGQFLQKNLSLDQLSVDLYNGKGAIHDVYLDAQALNELGEKYAFPIEFVDGFIGSVSVSIPWSSVLSDSSVVEVQGLMITLQPKQKLQSGNHTGSLKGSLLGSMMSSLQIAEECLRVPSADEKEFELSQPLEGLELFAQTIDTVFRRVRVSFTDTVIRLEHFPKDQTNGVALELRIKKVEYFDEAGIEETFSSDGPPSLNLCQPVAFSTKKFCVEGISIYTDEFSSRSHHLWKSYSSSGLKTPERSGNLSPGYVGPQPMNLGIDDSKSPSEEEEGICDPVLIARLTEKQEVKLTLKEDKNIAGPQFEIELNLGLVPIFLSPHQIHVFLEILHSLKNPGSKKAFRKQSTNKPMDKDDFNLVEQELQKHLGRPNPFAARSLKQHQGWSTHSLNDSEDEFHPMHVGNMHGSKLSESCDMDSSAGTQDLNESIDSLSSSKHFAGRLGKNIVQGLLDETLSDETKFQLTCSSICLFLLQEDIYTSPTATPGKAQDSPSPNRISEKFFDDFLQLFHSERSIKQLIMAREKMAAICGSNHIGLIAAPVIFNGNKKSSSSQSLLSANLVINNFELFECLVDKMNTSSDGQRQTATYTELLKFSDILPYAKDNELPSWNEPSVRIKYVQKESYNQTVQSTISFQLGILLTEIDITIVDRLHSLFNWEPNRPKWANGMGTVSKILEEERSLSTTKIDVHLSSPFLVVNIRFPIPDLRPVNSLERPPWWKKNLRDEVLIIEMTEATLSSSWKTNASDSKFELQCKDAHGLFQMSRRELPFSFCRIAVDPRADKTSSEHGFDWPRLVLKKCPVETPSLLEPDMEDDFDSVHMASSMHTYMNHMNAPNVSPFTSRKVVYDRSSPESKQNANLGDAADQVIMPAEKEQMNDFIDKTLGNCKLTVEISLPTLNVFLPSKTFYEVLYNRISTDLVFWEPAAPKPVYSSESVYQSYHLNSHLIRESTYFEAFSVCKSGAQCDSSSDSEDGGTGAYYSIYDTGKHAAMKSRKSNSSPQIRAQSNIAVHVVIGQGILNFFTCDICNESALEEESIGEFQINVEDGMFFCVSGHNGSPEVSYTCLNLNQGSLYHCGTSPTPLPRTVKPAILRTPSHLRKTVYQSESGALPILNSATLTGEHCDLFSLVVRTGFDPNQGLKTFKVALGLQEATMRHQMSPMSESWISQLIGFFDVSNHPVAGYSPPVVITELHFHLHSCAVDYRPLYLPICAMATVDNFSISSNLAATTTTSLLRIISEELCLYISNKTDEDSVDLKKNYVCVVDTGLFDLSLRMSDGKDSPLHDLRATNNTVHIHTCSDSCRALQDLILYFAADGDLQSSSDTYFDASDEPHSFLYNDGKDEEPSTLVNRLMEDAMLENMESSSESSVEVEESQEPGSFYVKEPGNLYDNQVERKDSNDSDEFCILEDDLGSGIVPASGEPQVRQLTNSSIRIIENHFAKPVGRSDLLKAPAHFPRALKRYTLKEMSLIWHLYGGQDFQPLVQEKQEEKKKKARVVIEEAEVWNHDDYGLSTSPRYEVSLNLETKGIAYRKGVESVWANINTDGQNVRRVSFQQSSVGGGQGRSRDILVELQMNKLRFQHEVYPVDAEYASRQVLLIQDLEIRDRLATSEINKLLYQFSSEALPRQTHANMVHVKAVHIRPDPSVPTSECSLRISLKPLRLNIDQDTLLFLCNFFGKLSSSESVLEDGHLDVAQPLEPANFGSYPNRMDNMSSSGKTDNSDASSSCSRVGPPIFFRSLIFSPDVPIQLDYHGKHVDMDQGALAGLLMGLGHLNQSRIILKRISYRHGLLGMDRLSAYVINEWLQDIKKNQLPSLLGGLGPMHSFVQLFQGVRDLIWLPIEQYRRDGRIMRGIQRGANSFTTSTTMAFLELTNRMVLIIQGAAEFAYDLVSPGPSVKSHSHVVQNKWGYNRQPMDIREGVANAYHVVREGIGDTARNIIRVTSEEHEHKGVPGAVGGVLRQIPPIMVKPIILATEATSNVLGGVRNQLVPDARRDAVEKWRARNQH